jgi:hypothetical protein
MKSTPKVTDGPAGARPRAAEVIGPRPGSTFGTGIKGTWAVKTSDKRGSIALGILKVVQGGVGMLGLIPDVTGLVPVIAGLGGGVTNTSDTLLPSSSAIGLDGRVWKDSYSFSNSARVCRTRSRLVLK